MLAIPMQSQMSETLICVFQQTRYTEIRCTNAVIMLAHCLRRWPNIIRALAHRLLFCVFEEMWCVFSRLECVDFARIKLGNTTREH